MTGADRLADDNLRDLQTASPGVPLPYTALARDVHARLAEIDSLFDFLGESAKRIEELIRPPFGRVRELKNEVEAGDVPAQDHRDPRVTRDLVHDMRMPPYMRDSDGGPLSLTRRQYDELMALVKHLRVEKAVPPKPAKGVSLAEAARLGASPAVGGPMQSPLRRRVAEDVGRLPRDDEPPVKKKRS